MPFLSARNVHGGYCADSDGCPRLSPVQECFQECLHQRRDFVIRNRAERAVVFCDQQHAEITRTHMTENNALIVGAPEAGDVIEGKVYIYTELLRDGFE